MLRTRSGLRIRSWWEDDEVGLVWDNGKQCFSALPFFDPNHAILALLFAHIACCTLATLAHLLANLQPSTLPLTSDRTPLRFLGSATNIHFASISCGGLIPSQAPMHPCSRTCRGFLTKVSNLRFRSMLAQHHWHTTHTDCRNELGAQCTTRSCL